MDIHVRLATMINYERAIQEGRMVKGDISYDDSCEWLHKEGMVNGEVISDDVILYSMGFAHWSVTEKGKNFLKMLEL